MQRREFLTAMTGAALAATAGLPRPGRSTLGDRRRAG